METSLVTAARRTLMVTVSLLAGLSTGGCTRSNVLPPPTASIPSVPRTAAPNVGRTDLVPSVTAAGPKLGSNPWKPTTKTRDWKYIVVHHTATESGSVDTIHESHLKNKDKNGNPWLGIGYHFVIGNGSG